MGLPVAPGHLDLLLPQGLSPQGWPKTWQPSGVTLYYSMVSALANPGAERPASPRPVEPARAARAVGYGLLGFAAGLGVQGLFLAFCRPAGPWRLVVMLWPLPIGAAGAALATLLGLVLQHLRALSWRALGADSGPCLHNASALVWWLVVS